MIPGRSTFYCRWPAALLAVLALSFSAPSALGQLTCGDVDGIEPINMADASRLQGYLYLNETPLPDASLADMDGVPGITNNDLMTLMDFLYTTFNPLDCETTADSAFQPSADTIEFRNTHIAAGAEDAVVEIWLKAIDEYIGLALPFSFDCPTSAIVLDSIEFAGDFARIDTAGQKGLLAHASWGVHPAGEQLLARLYFSVTPAYYEQAIGFETTDFPPSNTTAISRAGTSDREIDGFVPVLWQPQPSICGDLDGSGSLDLGDLTYFSSYLYTGGPAPFPLWVADLDGVPGITGNDYYTLIDHWYISLAGLNCNVVQDSTFQPSADTIKIRGATVGAMEINPHVVEVWMKATDEYFGLHLPLSYEFAPSPLTLDSVVGENGYNGIIDPVDQLVLISGNGTSVNPPGEQLVARLYFTITNPVIEPEDILIDTTGFPPGHRTVVSRAGSGERAVDGFVPAFTVVSDGACLADGDVNNNGILDITDATALTNFVFLGGPAPDPLYKADVTGDCVVDSLDIVALTCVLFGGCDDPPVLPVPTCCAPRIYAPGDTVLALGEADIAYSQDTMFVNLNRDDGSDGARIYGDLTRSRGIRVDLVNADLSQANAGLEFSFNGYVEGPEKMPQGTMQAMASVGIYNNGSGSLQVYGDFSPAGDPNVLVEVYISGVGLTGSATVPGGGLIAFGNEYSGGGLPSILSAAFQTAAPPTFSARLSVTTEFSLVSGPTLVGDSIRLIGANANPITHCSTFDLNGLHITFLGLINIKTNACCRGFTGNVDCDNVDVVDITDIQVLVDNLFLTLTPLCCEREAGFNYPGSGYPETDNIVDITDLSILIDNQFLTLSPLPACP